MGGVRAAPGYKQSIRGPNMVFVCRATRSGKPSLASFRPRVASERFAHLSVDEIQYGREAEHTYDY